MRRLPVPGGAAARLRDLGLELFVSAGGLGFAPLAPGTFGTLGGAAVAGLWGALLPQAYLAAVLATAAALVAAGAPAGRWAQRRFGCPDPQPVVLDEVAGYLVAAAGWSPAAGFPRGFPGWAHLGLAFLLFRLADVVKPPPARRLEGVPGGWGIFLDDLAAGAWACAGLWILRAAWPSLLGS